MNTYLWYLKKECKKAQDNSVEILKDLYNTFLWNKEGNEEQAKNAYLDNNLENEYIDRTKDLEQHRQHIVGLLNKYSEMQHDGDVYKYTHKNVVVRKR